MASWIDQEEIVELTQALIRSRSINPPGETAECAEIILKKFRKEGISAEIMEGRKGACNVVANLPGRKKGKVLLLNGHIDVVPPGEGWTVDPFGGEIQGGKIYGRGTCDMKSGIASMMAAMIGFKRSGAEFDGEILFMGVADEETGSDFGTLWLLEKKFGNKADLAIVSEPTSLRIELGNRGLRWIDITVRGRASHAGRPHLGVNAIAYGAKLIEAIHAMRFSIRNDGFEIPTPSISVTTIDGGAKVNIIPDRCTLAVDRRMMPGETTETVLGELKEVIDPVLALEKDLTIDVSVRPGSWDPYIISRDEPIVRVLGESCREITGREPVLAGKGACTDASHIFHRLGIPTVLFGPGDEKLSHKVDECVSIDALCQGTEIFFSLFRRLLS
jgi:succinyl-diaminopimelate desuccinylase